MSKIITNRNQYERLLNLLSERPDIAQGLPRTDKENVITFWNDVAVQLNSLGPPTKDMTSWKKVWLDYKCYVKRKLSINEAEARATGSGGKRMQTFNALEESVISFAGLVASTTGIKATNFGSGSSKSIATSEEDSISNPDAETILPTTKKKRRYQDLERDFETKNENQSFSLFSQSLAAPLADTKESQTFSLFGQSVAAQLSDLPEEEAFLAMGDIQNMLVARKVKTLRRQNLNKTQPQKTSRRNDEILICDVKNEYQVTEYLYSENE